MNKETILRQSDELNKFIMEAGIEAEIEDVTTPELDKEDLIQGEEYE